MISVITPSHGQLDWLRLALASVADQRGVELEHRVQDAGTPGIAELFREGGPFPQAKLFSEKDAGMYDAINRGLRRARGAICAWLNCDEQYLPGTLARVADFFRCHPNVEVVFADALIVDGKGRALAYRRAIAPKRAHLRASHLNVYSCATFFRRRLVEAGYLLDPKWKSIGDAIWVDQMLTSGVQMAILPELLSTFTLTGENLSTENPVSNEEKQNWLAESGGISASARTLEIMNHRLRKLFAGAYRKRTFDYEIYTRESPKGRVKFRAESIGGTWPVMRV